MFGPDHPFIHSSEILKSSGCISDLNPRQPLLGRCHTYDDGTCNIAAWTIAMTAITTVFNLLVAVLESEFMISAPE